MRAMRVHCGVRNIFSLQARTRFLNELTNGNAPYAPTLFFSLLNAIVVYDPVGWGVPFAGYVTSLTNAC